MAKNNSSNQDYTNNADGWDLSGGTTKRKLTVTGADITLTGSGTNTYTLPASSDTLVGRASTDTLTNKTLSTGTTFDNNLVPAAALATNAITLGYAQITTNFSTTASSPTQVTGLSASVTIPAGGRKVRITGWAANMQNTNAATNVIISIWDGTVGSGTELAYNLGTVAGTNYSLPATVIAVVTPSAGSKTYNIGFHVNGGGTATLTAATTSPAFILVEAI